MIRVRRWVAAAALGGAVVPITACNPGSEGKWADGPGKAAPAAAADIGGPLYPGSPLPKPADAAGLTADPIVVPNAVVQNTEKAQIAASVDGLIEMIAVPLADGEACPPGLVQAHPRNDKLRFRRLQVGDVVRKGDYICQMDYQQVKSQKEALEKTIAELRLAIQAAIDAENAQQKLSDQYEKLPGVSAAEKLNNIALVARYRENRIQSQKELAKTEGELIQADTQYQRFWVQSPFNGKVMRIVKNPGEFAKAGDPILEVQATDRVRIEGKLDIGYSELVRPGMRVLVEPVRLTSPTGPALSHRQEVSGVAVTGHPGRPLIVSASPDASVYVWDAFGPSPKTVNLRHPSGVRSVAATGRLAKAQMVATGSDDGRVRLWDVANPDKLATKELAVFDEAHGAAVSAAAFSPDGRFLATAAGRDVWVWTVADRKKLYALSGDHRDAVTGLRFTPQGTLLTAARDRAVRVWQLGDKAARVAVTLDHRGGGVDVLGVSGDGSKVLFDKDAGRLDLVSLADERSVGSVQASGGGRFAGLALFGPDDSLILTAGGEADQRGELTVWEAPQAGGRGAERRRLITRGGAAVTAAAFSPDPDKPFVVVGSADGAVTYWTAPGRAEMGRQMVATVVSSLPADARTVTLSVEMDNPTGQAASGLLDRSLATVIITPGSEPPAPPAPPPAPPAPAPVRPAGGAAPGGGVIPAGGVSVPANPPKKPQSATTSPSGVAIPAVPAPGGK